MDKITETNVREYDKVKDILTKEEIQSKLKPKSKNDDGQNDFLSMDDKLIIDKIY